MPFKPALTSHHELLGAIKNHHELMGAIIAIGTMNAPGQCDCLVPT